MRSAECGIKSTERRISANYANCREVGCDLVSEIRNVRRFEDLRSLVCQKTVKLCASRHRFEIAERAFLLHLDRRAHKAGDGGAV